MAFTYNRPARRRIQRSVEFAERGQRWPGRARRAAQAQPSRMVILSEDIEHNNSGNAKKASGITWDSTLSPIGDEITVFNPWHKLWKGSPALVQHGSLADTDPQSDPGLRWLIRQAWSATRLTGFATTSILPGETRTLDQLETMDGYFEPPTVEAFLPTTYSEIASGSIVWAELKYDEGSGASLWQIYAADCGDKLVIFGDGEWVADPNDAGMGTKMAGQAPYDPGALVTENGWAAYALVETSDHVAPQPTGSALRLNPTPTWTQQSTSTSQLFTGQRYTFGQPHRILNGIAYIPVASVPYRIVVVDRDASPEKFYIGAEFIPGATGERTVAVPISIVGTGNYDVLLSRESTSVGASFQANYNYRATNAGPIAGDIVHRNDQITLQVAFIDNDAVDQTANINALQTGDRITHDTDGLTWTIQGIGIPTVTYREFIVSPATRTLDGVSSFTFTQPGDLSMDWFEEANVWATQPTGITVQGFYQDASTPLALSNTAYSLDINVQPLSVSADWHLIGYPPWEF